MHFLLPFLVVLSAHGAVPVATKEWSKLETCEDLLAEDPLATLIRDYRANRNLGFDFDLLQKFGKEQLASSRITVTENLPDEDTAIVMYSGNMCIWCDLILPTYAKVSSSFQGPKLYLSKDPLLKKDQGIYSAPQLVLYARGLKVQVLGFGKSTPDFLQILGILSELSASSLKGHFAILDDGGSRRLFSVRDSQSADQVVSGKLPTDTKGAR